APGIFDTHSFSRSGSRTAGAQRTMYSPVLARPALPPEFGLASTRVGTTRPWATSSVAHTATRPSHRRLGAASVASCPAPTPTSQPRASPTGAQTARDLPPDGSGIPGWGSQAIDPAPASAISRSSSSAGTWGTLALPAASEEASASKLTFSSALRSARYRALLFRPEPPRCLGDGRLTRERGQPTTTA